MNTIQLNLYETKQISANINGYPYALEGGYRIVAGEVNATEFEISSVPQQYKDRTFTVQFTNAKKEIVKTEFSIPLNGKFTLPVGMAVAGYGQILIWCESSSEKVVWTPFKIKVWNTNPDWKADTIPQADKIEEEIEELTRSIPRPTYFKANGVALPDTGGVGTAYTIQTSSLTPSNITPIRGDVVIFNTEKSAYIGTVTTTDAGYVIVSVSVGEKVTSVNGKTGDVQIEEIDTSKFVTVDTAQGITGSKTFQSTTFFQGDVDFSGNARFENGTILVDNEGTDTTEEIHFPDRSGTLALKEDIPSGGGSQIYDTVISTQQEFEAWYKQLDEGTYSGASVLFLSGTYTRSGTGLHLPPTLKQLHGLGNVKISISAYLYSSTNQGGIWYTDIPTSEEYSIENISVSCTGALSHNAYAFSKCVNITNCTGSGVGTGASTNWGYGKAFSECANLTNCTGTGNGLAFYKCTNLTDCAGTCQGTYGSGGTGKGFYQCTNLSNCTGKGIGNGFSTGKGYGFDECTNLSNCTGSGVGESLGSGYGFYDCKICSNCRQDPDNPSNTATWGGTNTNVDPDTCPEYEDTRPFPPAPTEADNGKILGVVDSKLSYVEAGSGTGDEYVKIDGPQTIKGDKTFIPAIGIKEEEGDISTDNNYLIINPRQITRSDAILSSVSYKFPDKSGTFALLEDLSGGGGATGNFVTLDTEQTITADKTIKSVNGIAVQQYSGTSTEARLVADSLVFNWYDSDEGWIKTVYGTMYITHEVAGAECKYDFPKKSGTIALLSDITGGGSDSFVTLDTEQTISGHKTFDDLLRVSDGESTVTLSCKSLSYQDEDGGQFNYQLPNKNGTIALLEDISGGGEGGNYVTTDTEQIITGQKTVRSNLYLQGVSNDPAPSVVFSSERVGNAVLFDGENFVTKSGILGTGETISTVSLPKEDGELALKEHLGRDVGLYRGSGAPSSDTQQSATQGDLYINMDEGVLYCKTYIGWEPIAPSSPLPSFTTADNGKVLGIVDGQLSYVDKVTVTLEANTASGTTYTIKS